VFWLHMPCSCTAVSCQYSCGFAGGCGMEKGWSEENPDRERYSHAAIGVSFHCVEHRLRLLVHCLLKKASERAESMCRPSAKSQSSITPKIEQKALNKDALPCMPAGAGASSILRRRHCLLDLPKTCFAFLPLSLPRPRAGDKFGTSSLSPWWCVQCLTFFDPSGICTLAAYHESSSELYPPSMPACTSISLSLSLSSSFASLSLVKCLR
jgi:hypothetical protein